MLLRFANVHSKCRKVYSGKNIIGALEQISNLDKHHLKMECATCWHDIMLQYLRTILIIFATHNSSD